VFLYVIGLGNGDGVLCEIQAEVKEAVDCKKKNNTDRVCFL